MVACCTVRRRRRESVIVGVTSGSSIAGDAHGRRRMWPLRAPYEMLLVNPRTRGFTTVFPSGDRRRPSSSSHAYPNIMPAQKSRSAVVALTFVLLGCESPGSPNTIPNISGTYDYTMSADGDQASDMFGVLIISEPDASTGEFSGNFSYRFSDTANFGGEDDLDVAGEVGRDGSWSLSITGGPPITADRSWTATGRYTMNAMTGRRNISNGSLQYARNFSATRR